MNIDNYLDNLESPFKEIAAELRDLIYSHVEGVQTEILFSQPWFIKEGRLCYIKAMRGSVDLGFAAGRLLNDPDNLLEGKGKMIRYLKLKSLDGLPTDQIKTWLDEAVKLNTVENPDLASDIERLTTGDGLEGGCD